MDTTRQQKINRLLQKELSEIFRKQTQMMRGVLVSVSVVRVSPDLGECKSLFKHFPVGTGERDTQEYKNECKDFAFRPGTKSWETTSDNSRSVFLSG